MTRHDWFSVLAPFTLWLIAAFGRGIVWNELRPPELLWIVWMLCNATLAGLTGAAIHSVYIRHRR